ncbi:MAG: AAA family ATPase, partial [Desulfomonilaceae bacterium]
PWPLVKQIFDDPTLLPNNLAGQISKSLTLKWQHLPAVRRQLLELISRFELTVDLATCFYVQEEREECGIICDDKELLSNPYLLYELTRSSLEPISVFTVDRGALPNGIVRETHPLPEPSRLDGAADARRVRALTVEILEQAGIAGDTLLPQSRVIQSIRSLPLSPDCSVDQDLMNVIEDTMEPSVYLVQMKDGERAYKLRRLHQAGDIIRKAVLKRFNGKRHDLNEDWRKLLDQELKRKLTTTVGKVDEQRARQEKVAALQELGDSRISVLVGPSGTGKTTLLSTLCKQKDIAEGGVLLLAPTGKARVKLQEATGLKAQTLAQFLLHHDRYDERTGVYRLSDREPVQIAKTVIVDESSMLTEEQLGALIDSVAGVDRLILVGDPRQLPPIGEGRPFVDIVNKLSPENMATIFPKVGPSYAELTVPVRYEIATKAGGIRCDMQLADWFSGRPRTPGDDEMFDLMATDRRTLGISFVHWTDVEDLRSKIIDVLVKELRISGPDDETGFATKIGGSIYNGHVYFNPGRSKASEAWQILSPVRGRAHGISVINRWIQQQFRSGMLDFAHTSKKQIPRPMGPEGIIYGDKVISVVNNKRDKVYPKQDALRFVANGEIGTVVGKFRKFSDDWSGPLPLDVEFSSQPGFVHSYDGRDFGEETNPLLELAYAITVHKAQGSEFELCLLILPNPCRLISRELLYTALTRQKKRIVILHQGKRSDLIKYSSTYYSETARRLTNLFQDPQMVPVSDRFFENGLIHRTAKGEAVRSKSEVVIANSLFSKQINYLYEQRLDGHDGSCRFPDFTIKEDESGQVFYWEHLGMLNDSAYEKRWKQKLQWYKSQNILEFGKGGGSKGTLIISQDTAQGGIDSQDIAAKIDKIFGS